VSATGQIEGSRRVNAWQAVGTVGLFEADTLYADFVGKRNFYGYLASQRDKLFHDEDFAGLYQRIGRPSVPPSLMATALVLQAYDGVSDDEAKQRAELRPALEGGAGHRIGGAPVCQEHALRVSRAVDRARPDPRHLPTEPGTAARGKRVTRQMSANT